MADRVTIVDYDPRWPILYEQARRRIMDLLEGRIVAIEHIGSTAVPLLAAKPIIDIMIGVRHLDDTYDCIDPLARLGYDYLPELENDTPDRRFFLLRDAHGVRVEHLHLVVFRGDFWERHILFRDYLRTYRAMAQEYELLKRELADIHGADREAYARAKSEYIQAVVLRARSELGGGKRA